jgi:hypothetical protein
VMVLCESVFFVICDYAESTPACVPSNDNAINQYGIARDAEQGSPSSFSATTAVPVTEGARAQYGPWALTCLGTKRPDLEAHI